MTWTRRTAIGKLAVLVWIGLAGCAGAQDPVRNMDRNEFWNLIDTTLPARDDPDRQADLLRSRLERLDKAALEGFAAEYARAHEAAYTWDLWGAAYIINGGASDDAFSYFRDWLISRGRGVYEGALADPATLIEHAVPYRTEAELFGYAAVDVYERKFGTIEDYYEALPPPTRLEPVGTEWDESDAALRERFPVLYEWERSQR